MSCIFFPAEPQHLPVLCLWQTAQQYLQPRGILLYLEGMLGPFSAIPGDFYYMATKRRGRDGTLGNLGLVVVPFLPFICPHLCETGYPELPSSCGFHQAYVCSESMDLFFFFKGFSKTVSPLFFFLLRNTRKLENWQSLAIIHTS